MIQLLDEIGIQPVMAHGWQPGIGDPTLMGWATVALYFWAAFNSFRVKRHLRVEDSVDRRFWSGMSLILIFLGINKQLDLQSLLTQVGRNLAKAQGWYQYHRHVQSVFIVGVAVVGVVLLITLLVLFRNRLRECGMALLGLVILICFIVIRAASFHHVDRALGMPVGHVNLNFALECSGLILILVGALIASRHAKALISPA